MVVCAWMLALVAPAALAASEPAVLTGNATGITPTSATFHGTVNPGAQATTYYFEYGTATTYGTTTAVASAGSGTADVPVSAAISSLAPATRYHYRLVATNASGTTLGADVSFATPRPPAPVVSTGHATNVSQTSATLTGSVDPKGVETSYVFQYGTSTAYGSQTPAAGAGSGTTAMAVSAAVASLSPNTTYHYRLSATNANGTTLGHDISFKTSPLPAGVTLSALPDPITFGQFTSLSGRVLPPRPSRPTVTLQSAPSAGGPWVDASSAVAASTGAYSFPLQNPSSNTYYRVLADGATSPAVLVAVRFRVGAIVSRLHPIAGTVVRFRGRVGPAHNGLRVVIQRLGPGGRWHAIRRTRLRAAGGGLSFYSVRVRITRSGRYRVVVGPDAGHAAGFSRTIRIRVR